MWFGVQTIAASGLLVANIASMEVYNGQPSFVATSWAEGFGSTMHCSLQSGFWRTVDAWRGPMRPVPIMANVRGMGWDIYDVVSGFFLVRRC